MRLVESRSNIDAGTVRTRDTDRGDGHGLMLGWSANGDLVARRKTADAADFDIARAGVCRCREICAICLRANTRDFDGLDTMADAVDVAPEGVTDGDASGGCYLEAG